ncbi:hypothetical protein GY45DRAFT_1092553 [Cubamyces sp. BRFM 1775]|nr:hypothetical protein GY45DRAFT_1092553 [Cubamyces sp. BRFM 1775]
MHPRSRSRNARSARIACPVTLGTLPSILCFNAAQIRILLHTPQPWLVFAVKSALVQDLRTDCACTCAHTQALAAHALSLALAPALVPSARASSLVLASAPSACSASAIALALRARNGFECPRSPQCSHMRLSVRPCSRLYPPNSLLSLAILIRRFELAIVALKSLAIILSLAFVAFNVALVAFDLQLSLSPFKSLRASLGALCCASLAGFLAPAVFSQEDLSHSACNLLSAIEGLCLDSLSGLGSPLVRSYVTAPVPSSLAYENPLQKVKFTKAQKHGCPLRYVLGFRFACSSAYDTGLVSSRTLSITKTLYKR